MQVSVAHTALAPISEVRSGAGSGGVGFELTMQQPREPRRSLRVARPPQLPAEQPRRHTLLPPAGFPAEAATDAAAAAARRRQSSWRRAGSIRSSEGQAAAAARQADRLENTYRTGPTRPFQLEAAQALLSERLATSMRHYSYNAQSAPIMAKTLAQEVKNKMKQELLVARQRYKMVVLVTITEPSAPAGLIAARALWSAETGDACATAEFRNLRVAATAAVFAVYCE